jgi:transcriptional regulator with GAF, ATPase, and Fis domain
VIYKKLWYRSQEFVFHPLEEKMNLESLQPIILAVTQARSVASVLNMIVEGLSAQSNIALARIWLIGAGDICSICPMRNECPDQTRCLHLRASAGKSAAGKESWSRLDGDFRRFPLNVRKIGRIGSSGESILLKNVSTKDSWLVRPEWANRESIRSFAGHPLIFRNEILGALAVFSRAVIGRHQFSWLRTFADHAAVAIANARAFEEVTTLREQLELENTYLREEVVTPFREIVGKSPALMKVLKQIEIVAPTDASVLILGETGTGKELVARAIHERSLRSNKPFIKVNCSSIPHELFESEFFGHVKGAFTGAHKDRAGRFQMADGGTIFLDEVGEIPLELQSKLLRVLQEGQFERIGDDHTRHTNVRIIAATNRNPKEEVAAGTFRQDLFYRLSVFPVEVPALRHRMEDIPLLAAHLIDRACARLNCPEVRLTQNHVRHLQQYPWPGNVRELQNVIERAVIISQGGRLQLDLALPAGVDREMNPLKTTRPDTPADFIPENVWKQRERENIVAALIKAKGKVYGPGGAAELLGVKPTTLAYRLKKLGLPQARKNHE